MGQLLCARGSAREVAANGSTGEGDVEGEGAGSSAAACAVELLEVSEVLTFVDMRGNNALAPALATRLAAAVQRRSGALTVVAPGNRPGDGPSNSSETDGWHVAGLALSRSMHIEFQQTVWFVEGDDAGAVPNQPQFEMPEPQFVVEGPGGELARATPTVVP
jgi:hypothetical protein